MRILYFTDIDQLNYIRENKQIYLTDFTPLTFDLVVAFELRRLEINFIDGWDYLTIESITFNQDLSRRLSGQWWKELGINQIEFKGISLLDIVSEELVYPFEACLNASVVFQKLFNENVVDEIIAFQLLQIGIVRTGPFPVQKAISSVSQEVLTFFSKVYTIPMALLAFESPPKKINVIKKWKFKSVRDKFLNAGFSSELKTALVFTDIISGNEQKAVVNAFNILGGWNTSLINIYDLNANIIVTNNAFSSLLSQNWELIVQAVNKYNGRYPEIFGNVNLLFQFETIWNQIAIAVKYYDIVSSIFDILKPSVVVLGFDAFATEIMISEIARKKNISTFSLLHGGIGHIHGVRGIVGRSDKILVWNDLDIIHLKYYGISEARIFKIGAIKYEKPLLSYLETYKNEQIKDVSGIKKKYDIRSNDHVILLMTTAINAGLAAPVANPSLHVKAIFEIIALIQRRQDLVFVLKSHPGYDYYKLYELISKFKLNNFFYIEDLSIDDAFTISDICVMLNYYTTAGLEAMLANKPLLFFNNAVYDNPEFKERVSECKVSKISSVFDLEERIDRIRTDTELVISLKDENHFNICQFCDLTNCSSSEKFIDLISMMNFKYRNENNQVIRLINEISCNSFLNRRSHSNLFNEEVEDKVEVSALSFIAGLNNLKIGSVIKLVDFIRLNNKYVGSTKMELYQIGFNSFIAGYNSNTYKRNFLSGLILIAFLVLNPKWFYCLNESERKNYIKCILRMFLY